MAKETMLTVSKAETDADRLVKDAEQQCEAILSGAVLKGEELKKIILEDANQKSAALNEAAESEANNIREKALADTEADITKLKAIAEQQRAEASKQIAALILGTG